MQRQDVVNVRAVGGGIRAEVLLVRQPGGQNLAALRQIPGIAEQVKLRRAERQQQRKTACAEPDPAAPEDMDGLLQQHLSGEIAQKRADHQKQQHVPEVIRRIAGHQLHQDRADHQRAADRERI